MRHFVFRWIVTTVAVFVAAPVVGINYGGRIDCLLGASLLLGIVNAFIRPVLLLRVRARGRGREKPFAKRDIYSAASGVLSAREIVRFLQRERRDRGPRQFARS